MSTDSTHRAVDDAIKRGALDEIPRTLTVEDAQSWWTWQQARAMLKFVRGGLSPAEISQVFSPVSHDDSEGVTHADG